MADFVVSKLTGKRRGKPPTVVETRIKMDGGKVARRTSNRIMLAGTGVEGAEKMSGLMTGIAIEIRK